jgi:mercuric ion binding protein
MNLVKYLFIAILTISIVSCKIEPIKKTENIAPVQNIQHLEVNINGMTCEIGCAKLIESKVHKLEGITYSKVNFENKTGQFSFDANKISKEELTKNINGIAGGDLYKVASSQIVNKFREIPKTHEPSEIK